MTGRDAHDSTGVPGQRGRGGRLLGGLQALVHQFIDERLDKLPTSFGDAEQLVHWHQAFAVSAGATLRACRAHKNVRTTTHCLRQCGQLPCSSTHSDAQLKQEVKCAVSPWTKDASRSRAPAGQPLLMTHAGAPAGHPPLMTHSGAPA